MNIYSICNTQNSPINELKKIFEDKDNASAAETMQKTAAENTSDTDDSYVSELSVMLEHLKESSKDTKASNILTKFYSGKKISKAELNYLAEHMPEAAEKVRRIMAEREMLEKAMKAARTKTQVSMCSMMAMSNAGKNKDNSDPYTSMARMNQLSDAYHEYTKTSEFKDKPLDELEEEREKKSGKRKYRKRTDAVEILNVNNKYMKAELSYILQNSDMHKKTEDKTDSSGFDFSI